MTQENKKLKMYVEYEDNEIQIKSEYDPAQHIYMTNDEINLWKRNIMQKHTL